MKNLGSSSSYPYTIYHEKLVLHLKIVDINSLFLHEEIIPEMLEQLFKSIKEDKVIRHPVIVDEKSLVVLDGMHRVAALRRLNCKRIPVCLVDYSSPSVTVGCWYRTIKNGPSIDEKFKEITRLGFELKKKNNIEEDEIGENSIIAGLKTFKASYLIRRPFKDMKDAYDYIKIIEEGLKRLNLKVEYETEIDAFKKLSSHAVNAVLLTPKLSKENIIKTALSGRVFAHKATRHVIPARPLYVNVPLSLLSSENISLSEANEQLREILTKKKLKLIRAGSIIEDRRYEEDTYLFED